MYSHLLGAVRGGRERRLLPAALLGTRTGRGLHLRRARPVTADTRVQHGLHVAPPTPANPLERAARIIERRGWCQNRFVDGRGGVCLDFALVLSGPDVNEAARRVVEAELRRRGGPDSVVRWNDEPGRSQVEVVGLLRAASRHWPPSRAREA